MTDATPPGGDHLDRREVRVEIDGAIRPGATSDELKRLKEVERENAELRRANEIRQVGGVFSGRNSTASQRGTRFIDENKAEFGVEPPMTVFLVAWRNIRASLANPPLLIPPIAAPLMFFVTFVGAFSSLGRAPGFDFPSGYTSFQFVFIVLQAGAFNGVFMGFSVARDWESGFAQRLFLASPNRRGLVVGYVLAAWCCGRWRRWWCCSRLV